MTIDQKKRAAIAKEMLDRPLDSTETPKGQKFDIGQKVRLTKVYSYFELDDILTIQYSYHQKYGFMCGENSSSSKTDYSVIREKDGFILAWLPERILEAIVGGT